jgi:hypothetical protein
MLGEVLLDPRLQFLVETCLSIKVKKLGESASVEAMLSALPEVGVQQEEANVEAMLLMRAEVEVQQEGLNAEAMLPTQAEVEPPP